MANPTPKSDRNRQMREEWFARGQQRNKDAAAIAKLRDDIAKVPVKRAPKPGKKRL